MQVEITLTPDPKNASRTIYGLIGPSFEAVQAEIERLMNPTDEGRSFCAHFMNPFHDRATGRWLSCGSIEWHAHEAA